MNQFLNSRSHRRLNILTGEWVLVSPNRNQRPWQGQEESQSAPDRPHYDPACYLCPGNKRHNDSQNPNYTGVFVFDNDFPALETGREPFAVNESEYLVARSEQGICRVVCFSPNHSLSLSQMTRAEIADVIRTWQEQTFDLGSRAEINYVQIFENKGQIMGCSNPHPHGQIWATESIPDIPAKEDAYLLAHWNRTGTSLLSEYLSLELEKEERIVLENQHFVVLVPFWATWPFETMILPKRHIRKITELDEAEVDAFAAILQSITSKYDRLFRVSFPYSSGIHQAPTTGGNQDHWHLHMHFFPPLLRSATVKKFMVGFEMLGRAQRDFTPEFAAELLTGI